MLPAEVQARTAEVDASTLYLLLTEAVRILFGINLQQVLMYTLPKWKHRAARRARLRKRPIFTFDELRMRVKSIASVMQSFDRHKLH